ncbi:MAG: YihY/virulence factor BrkB family protein [Candidatus Krumholzibacteriia bacterium]|nr:YihY/virulence factor BrkB family protein [Candidatus Latescibacterota bacterium]MCB9515743.1 YihY/virulence factor BrkB family protein [Candidatus Latescibacterota bacterium]
MKRRLGQARRYLVWLWREYQHDRCGQAAASLAFGTLLSLVPLVALLAWLTRPFHRYISNPLESMAPFFTPTPRLQEIIQANVSRYADNAGKLGVVGLVFFLFVAWGMLGAIESVINDIWHVSQRRGQMRRLLRFWVAIAAVPVLFIASAALNQALERAVILKGLMQQGFYNWLLADLLPFLLLTASASIAYWVLPAVPVRARAALTGGLVTGALYNLVRWLFGLYVSSIGTYDRIYGLLGVIPAFLIWLVIVWSVVLLGAEVAYSVQRPWDEVLPP